MYGTKLPSIITLFNKISLPSFISFLLWCYAVSGCPMFFYPSCHVGTSSNVRQSTGVWQEDLKWFTRILEILNQISWCVRMIQCHSTVQCSTVVFASVTSCSSDKCERHVCLSSFLIFIPVFLTCFVYRLISLNAISSVTTIYLFICLLSG